jgi:hypothetical protein
MHLPDAQAHIALESLWRSGGTVGVGLSLTVPDDVVSPGSVSEVVAASYDRVSLATTLAGFADAVDRAIQTIVAQTFPAPAEDWGVVLAIVLWSTTTKATGTPVGAVRLSTGVNILADGAAPVVPAGVIRFVSP